MTDSKSSTHVGKDQHTNVAPGTDSTGQPCSTDDAPLNIRLGRQLRAAREAQQFDIEDCGHTLRLPVRVLKKLEAGDYAGISEGVYLRNYLMSYGTCLGLSEASLREAIDQLAPTEKKPQLVSTGGIPRTHYLWQRYTTAAAAVVLTAVVVVPLVWLGLKGGLDRELTRLEPLNSAPVTSQEVTASSSAGNTQSAFISAVHTSPKTETGQPVAEKPLMASMAPFSALDSIDDDMSSQPVAPPAVAVPGSHTLSITLSKPSWVEVITADGKRLEYSLLPAGAQKVYHSTQPLHVSIGNTAGAQVSLDGKAVDLATYKHANVSHFRIALKGGRAVVQSM